MLKRTLCLIAIAALMILGGNAHAQESAIIQATASVVSSMAVQGTNGLAFGAVTPGVNKSVDKTAAGSAGEWLVNGAAGAEVTLAITLPGNLDHATDPALQEFTLEPVEGGAVLEGLDFVLKRADAPASTK